MAVKSVVAMIKIRSTFALLTVVAVFMALLAGAAHAAPADGNGNKEVFAEDWIREAFGFPETVTCPDGTELDLDLDGWYQVMKTESEDSKSKSPIVRRAVFHATLTYTNPEGESWRYVDVGPERVFYVDGEPYIALSGRLGLAPDPNEPGAATTMSGTVWFNLDTREILHVAGNVSGETPREQACHELT